MAQERRGESELIAHYFAPLASGDAAFGLSDDAAFLTPPQGYDLVLTKDMLVSDIHFFANDPPREIAQKALRVNLSDLAAKGAKPYGYLLGLGLPKEWSEDWLVQFVDGLKEDQKIYDFALFGGDTVKSPERLTLSITAFGLVPSGSRIVRPHARIGDQLYMSGTLGDAALGLLARLQQLPHMLPAHHLDSLKARYLLPQPRTKLAPALQNHARAAMDISDGLLGDAAKMAKACGACLHICTDDVPLSAAAMACLEQEASLISTILSGGDDYEILMAIPTEEEMAFLTSCSALEMPVTKIGYIEQGEGVKLSGQKWPSAGEGAIASFEHF